MKYRVVAAALVIALLAFGSRAVHDRYQLHVLNSREFDENPVPGRPVSGIEPSLSIPVRFQRTVLDDRTFKAGRKPKVIIDPDGHGAVVGARVGPLGFALYRRQQTANWVIRPSLSEDAEDAQTTDVNGDGAPDIVVGGIAAVTYALLNPRHTACADVYRCPWTPIIVDRSHSSHDVVVGDVDLDGAIDIATEAGIYFNRRNGRDWKFAGRNVINRDGEGTSLAALDADGILDIVAPYESGTKLARFINPLHHHGDPVHDHWEAQMIDEHPLFSGNMTTAITDVNHNGRNDILLAPMYGGGGLVWYEAPPKPAGRWIRHMIDPTINFVHQGSLQLLDFNGDGHLDIAFAEQDQSPTRRVGVFYNVSGEGAKWRLQVLSTEGGHNIKAGLLGVGKVPSIVSARHGFFGETDPLVVWSETAKRG